MNNWTESGLLQPNSGRLAGDVIDGHSVKALRALFDVALAKEIVRGANQGYMLFLGNVQFGEPKLAFNGEANETV